MAFAIARAPAAAAPGLVAYQFAWRFHSAELADPTAELREARKRYRDAMLKAELGNPFGR